MLSRRKSYDVFISYRREGGLDFARSIAYYLRIEGLQCFFDQRELKTGQFNQQIYEAIENSKYFLAVITPGSLERCVDENDWVRKEIEHAIRQGLTVIPVAVRGEKLIFPDSLPQTMTGLKTAQASFIDRETDFEDTIVKMLRDQMTNLSEKTVRQRDKSRIHAEKVFLKKARRFKGNDGVIDDEERAELERLASASGISRNRLEELVERVEASAVRREMVIRWIKRHPLVFVPVILGVACVVLALLWLLFSGVGRSLKGLPRVSDVVSSTTSTKSVGEGDIEGARTRLQQIDSRVASMAESDLLTGINTMRRPRTSGRGADASVKWIEDEYQAVMKEVHKLSGLGMQAYEITSSRPDLVLRLANIRLRFADETRKLVQENRHEEALVYYNAARAMFQQLRMRDLDRPSFTKQ